MPQRLLVSGIATVFLLHAVEEYVTDFWTVDPSTQWLSSVLLMAPFTTWLAIQLSVLVFFVIFYVFVSRRIFWIALFGILLFELSHPFLAIQHHAYYPGVLTSLLFLPLGWFVFQQIRSQGPLVYT